MGLLSFAKNIGKKLFKKEEEAVKDLSNLIEKIKKDTELEQ